LKIFVVGAGMGGEGCLTQRAREVIAGADIVLASKRLRGPLAGLNPNCVCLELHEILPFLSGAKQDNIAVAVSGDVGFYSFARTLKERIAGDIEFIPGVSSMQYLAAKLGMPYDDAVAASVHGRDTNIIPYVCYNRKVFALTGGAQGAREVISRLNARGLGFVSVHVGENLSYADERVTSGAAGSLEGAEFSGNSVMFIINENFVNSYESIPDGDFIRDSDSIKIPMTKQAVRALALAKLSIAPGDSVADIGAGTGAMAVEMARRANKAAVYAVERDAGAIRLIRQNIVKHGAYNIEIITGCAPDCMKSLPRADKAFIGGSSGFLREIMAALLENNGAARIAATAVTLETLNAALAAFREFGLEYGVTCVNAANAAAAGGYHLMKAENPVYIIAGERKP